MAAPPVPPVPDPAQAAPPVPPVPDPIGVAPDASALAPPSPLSAADAALVIGVRAGQRRALAKAITLVESGKPEHLPRAQALLAALGTNGGQAWRIGISGVPGGGKSTLIEALGMHLIAQGMRVAVLAVDPSSSVAGGSILGDKTRMEKLAQREEAFIRPSPARGALGGVGHQTREAMLLCEAAGFDVVIVETVGVGQSETAVAGMTDVFVVLQLPNAGDDLQGMKKGILELADIIVYNKADLDARAAEVACGQMRAALHLLRPATTAWQVPVLAASALRGDGVAALWEAVQAQRLAMQGVGLFDARRQRQALDWMWALVDAGLRQRLDRNPQVAQALPDVLAALARGDGSAALAAQTLLAAFDHLR